MEKKLEVIVQKLSKLINLRTDNHLLDLNPVDVKIVLFSALWAEHVFMTKNEKKNSLSR